MSSIEGPGNYYLRLDSIGQLIRPSIENRRVFRETWMPQYSVATYSFDKHPLIIFHPLHCFATAIIFHLAWSIHLIHDSRIREKQNIAHFLITILGLGWQGQLLTFARYAYYLISPYLVGSISGQFSWLGSQSYLRTVEMERNLKSLVVLSESTHSSNILVWNDFELLCLYRLSALLRTEKNKANNKRPPGASSSPKGFLINLGFFD